MSTNSSIFHELRPLCIDLSRLSFQPKEAFDPNSLQLRDALSKLETKLGSYEDEAIQPNLADYVFVPISSLLKQDSLGETQSSYVLLIISHLLRLSWRKNGTLAEELAEQLLPLLTFLISCDVENEKLDLISQDCKRAGSSALHHFTKSLAQQVYGSEFFSSQHSKRLTALSHSISVLLTIFEQSSKDSETQLQILDTLHTLYCGMIRDGELLSFILPGNISSFTKVLVMPGMTTNYKVVIETLNVMKQLILLVYDDLSLNVHENRITDVNKLDLVNDLHDEALELKSISVEIPHQDGQNIHRSTSWLRATSAQLRLAFDSFIMKLQRRNNLEIQKALVDFASDLLSRCSKSLHNCERIFVDTLLKAKMDPRSQLISHSACLRDLIRDDITKVSGKIQFLDTAAVLSLNYGLASLTEFGSIDDALLVNEICKSVLDAIQSAVEVTVMKKTELGVLEQNSNLVIANDFGSQMTDPTDLQPLFPTVSKELEKSLGSLIVTTGRLASKHGQLGSIIATLLSDQVTQSTMAKAIALWISSQMTLSLQENSSAKEETFLHLTSDEVVDKESCYVILEFGNDLAQEVVLFTEGKTLSRVSEISLAVIINSIGISCTVLGGAFSSELIDYLYVVVENLASPSPTIRQFAQSCSLTIAHVLYDDSIQNMILENVDYLAESISSRLNSGLTERVSTVFMVVCKLAGYESIECFKDIIETIFKLLDYYHAYDAMCLEFFQLFEVIALEIQRRYFTPNADDRRLTHHSERHRVGSPWGMTNIQQVLAAMDKDRPIEEADKDLGLPDDPKNFQEYFDSKLRVHDSDDEEEEDPEEPVRGNPPKQEDEWVSPIPRESYRILLQVLGYGDRLLTHRSRPLKIQILRVMKLMTPMIASQYNSLLPQVAQTWDTLVLCSLDDDPSVVKPACECLQEFISYAGDFITTRFLELWKSWKGKSALLRELQPRHSSTKSTSLVRHKKFPTVTHGALNSMSQVLIEGILVSGLTIPDLTSMEMVFYCIQVIPPKLVAAKSLALADTVAAIFQEA